MPYKNNDTRRAAYRKSFSKKQSSSWVNTRVRAQNKKLTNEMNSAAKSHGLIKARLMSLTAKVSIMESELSMILEMLNVPNDIQAELDRKEIGVKLLAAAEFLGEEE